MNEAISKSLIEGFTLSPRPSNTPGTVAGAPLNGYHCVALPGSDMLLPKDISLLADGRPEQRTLNALDSWLNYMRPVFASGQAWVGGYLRGSGPNAGRFEINVTVVFRPEHEQEAAACGRCWNQETMWSVDCTRPADEPQGRLTLLGGTGEGSVFADPDEPDHRGRARPTVKSVLAGQPAASSRRRRGLLWGRKQ